MQESNEVKSEVKLDVVSTQPARDSVGGKGAEEKVNSCTELDIERKVN